MSVVDQMYKNISDTTGQARVLSGVVGMISPRDTPFLTAIGGLDSARQKFKISMNGYKVEWIEDELSPLSDSISASMTADTLTFYMTDASKVQPGTQIKIDSELMIVGDRNTSTNLVTVQSREYGGTNATHAASAVVSIVGMAREEGATISYGALTVLTNPYNYTSIVQRGLSLSRTVLKQSNVEAIGDLKTYQSIKKIPELLREINLACYYSQRQINTASLSRSMGGLNTFVTDNTVNAGGSTITKAMVDTGMLYCYNDGGNPDILLCNPATAGGLRDLIDTSSYVRLNYENYQLGMLPLKRFNSQYGQLQIVMDRFCPTTDAYLLESGKVGMYTFDDFKWEDAGRTADSKDFDVTGEFSLVVQNDKAHARIYGLG